MPDDTNFEMIWNTSNSASEMLKRLRDVYPDITRQSAYRRAYRLRRAGRELKHFRHVNELRHMSKEKFIEYWNGSASLPEATTKINEWVGRTHSRLQVSEHASKLRDGGTPLKYFRRVTPDIPIEYEKFIDAFYRAPSNAALAGEFGLTVKRINKFIAELRDVLGVTLKRPHCVDSRAASRAGEFIVSFRLSQREVDKLEQILTDEEKTLAEFLMEKSKNENATAGDL